MPKLIRKPTHGDASSRSAKNHATAWKKSEEKFDWTPFVKTGAELDRFVSSEQQRVQGIVADLKLAG